MNPENKAQIQSNRRKIFELEMLINSNKTKVEVCRASVEQNYASIMRNYNAAYMGNHHLANQETDEILRKSHFFVGLIIKKTPFLLDR